MVNAVMITGGNLGDVAGNLAAAREMIAAEAGMIVVESSVRKSAPWGFESPDWFLNQVLVVETSLEAEEVLARTQGIERRLGRERPTGTDNAKKHYASRTMDIDLLFYGDRVIETPALTLPHPRIAERVFVLDLLCEIMPDYHHPVLGKTMHELRETLRNEHNTHI